ncbi:helix-turn-helix transcriptional regulator [Streptomyces sp. NPDC048057]|uniref:helix-turn-helix transcriptional regulator n=1 Tax=Streptomyces sp. NPDC048057 TaxID=3155628 RepID=UPI0033C4282A
MAPVFAHGRLRLYLLKLLDESPRHGYEVIRLLEERFHGLYAPSAGTVYPRLAKLEAEGLVTHATEGGRKVYSLTDAGRAELAGRGGELADLEREIRESVSELAAEIRDDVRGAAGKLRSEVRAAASQARSAGTSNARYAAHATKASQEEWRKVTHEWQEQARLAREEAQQAKRQAKEAQEKARTEMARIAQQVQEQVQGHFSRGDWPAGLRDGLTELSTQLSGLTRTVWSPQAEPEQGASSKPGAPSEPTQEPGPVAASEPVDSVPDWGPDWAEGTPATGDPARDLDRLLDRFRDDVRDAARDHGVTKPQFDEARRHLATAAVRISALLRSPEQRGDGG